MKHKNKVRLLSYFVAASLMLGMSPAEGLPNNYYDIATTVDAASVGDKFSVGNDDFYHKGTSDNYLYEVWMEQRGINGTMTIGQGATFNAEWNVSVPSGNFIARRGLDLGSEKKATDYKYIGIDYEAEYSQTGGENGNSRLCAYGWSPQEVVKGNVLYYEYYIIEDWVDWCPDAPGKIVMIDGAEYKIFKLEHSYPSINGPTEIFNQYFSVRQDKRTSGHITVSDHFKAWADEGWTIGKLSEVTLNVEGWQSSGVAEIKKLSISTGWLWSDDDNNISEDPEQSVTTSVVTTTPEPVTTTNQIITSDFEPVEIKGDIDGNNAVTASDLVKLMQAMLGKISFTSQQTSSADIDGDGKVSIVDLIKLKNMLI